MVNFLFSLLFSGFIDPVFAYIGGYLISLFATYALNSYLIFKLPFSFSRFLKFTISYIPNFLILVIFVAVLLNGFGFPKVLVYLAAAAFGLPLTFVLVKIFAFSNKNTSDILRNKK